MTRRAALRLAPATTLGAAACSFVSPASERPTPANRATVTPTRSITSANPYRELENLTPTEDKIVTTNRSTTRLLNYLSRRIDEVAALATINYMEELARSNLHLDYDYQGGKIPFVLGFLPRTRRVIYIVPGEFKSPSWSGVTPDTTSGTVGLFDQQTYFSFVKVVPSDRDLQQNALLNNTKRYSQFQFATLIGYSTINIGSSTVPWAELGKKLVPESLATALALKNDGGNFDQFDQWAKSTKPEPFHPYPPLTLPRKVWDGIPILQPVY